MYDAVEDIYCYPGTSVLKNRLDLHEQADLDAFEAEITAARAGEPLPAGKLDYTHYKAINHHLFQDVYPWAGKIRTVRISKGGNPFCFPENIDREMRRLFRELAAKKFFRNLNADDFAMKATHFLAELNAIHAFREGNGRTQLSFLTLLAEEAGYPLQLEKLDPQTILSATIKSFEGDEKPLIGVLKNLVGSR